MKLKKSLTTLSNMDRKQISYMQQALWKLEAARQLVRLALGDTDAAQLLTTDISGIMEDIESDIAESFTPESI